MSGEWREMQSAPQDGTKVRLMLVNGTVKSGVYLIRKDIWVSPDGAEGYDPVLWQPSPKPGEQKKAREQK